MPQHLELGVVLQTSGCVPPDECTVSFFFEGDKCPVQIFMLGEVNLQRGAHDVTAANPHIH